MNSHLFIVGQVTIISNVNGDAFPAVELYEMSIGELWGGHLSTKSFIAKHYFFLIILMIENNQTLVPNKNAASFLDNFFGVKCVVPSFNPVARLLVSPGAYKPCWEWVDRCDRPGDFLGAGQCS